MPGLVANQRGQLLLLGDQLLAFSLQRHFLKTAKRAEPHVENGVGLCLGQLEPLHQPGARVLRLADDGDDLVEIEIDDEIPLENLETRGDLAKPEVGAADKNLAAVRQPGIQRFPKRHHARAAVGIEHIQGQRHARFKVCQLEQALHHHFRLETPALRLKDDAQVLGRLVADIGEERQLLGLQHIGHPLDQPGFLHLIGNFGNDDLPGPAFFLLDRPASAHPESAAPGGIGLANAVGRLDEDAAGWEIGPSDITHQSIHRSVRMLDQMQRRIGKFGDIVRRDRCRHADRDTLRAICQQVWDAGRKQARLLGLAVIGRAEIDRILVDAIEQELRDLGHPRLGVAHRGGVIAIDIAEIALPVDKLVAHREFLRQPDHRIIDRRIPMRVELAHDIADNAG